MRKIVIVIVLLPIWLSFIGCEGKTDISRDEIPLIKQTIAALERVVIDRNTIYLDSLLCSEAASEGMTSDSIISYIYNNTDDFKGFTEKQILYSDDAARIDCVINSPDGPVNKVTITLKREDGLWLFKKIEPRVDDPIPPIKDTVAVDSQVTN